MKPECMVISLTHSIISHAQTTEEHLKSKGNRMTFGVMLMYLGHITVNKTDD